MAAIAPVSTPPLRDAPPGAWDPPSRGGSGASAAGGEEIKFWGPAPAEEFYASQGVSNRKAFASTPYGTLFTQCWLPQDRAPRALVFLTHGYSSDTSWTFQRIGIAFAQWGYAAYAADLLGHGQSDGLRGYVKNVDHMAAASLHFYKSVCRRPEYGGLKRFLFGESMGAGATFLMLLQELDGGDAAGSYWDGAVFSAPLFLMPETMSPSRLRLAAYALLGGLAETWAVMPINTVVGNCLKDPAKAQLVIRNPRRYAGRARVGTMRQLCRMCDTFRRRCADVRTPFLVLHGTADNITDPEGSQMLYDTALSTDKSIRLYDGLYHSLIQAELDDNAALVLSDIKAWLAHRTPPPAAVSLPSGDARQ